MSQENVEIVRRLWEAARRRDTEAVLALYDADVEVDGTGLPWVAMEGAVYRGHDGLKRLFAEWRESWREADAQLDRIVDAGDRVVSIYTYRAQGRASGTPIEEEFATVSTVRSGKVVRVQWFMGRAAAFEAVGLGIDQK
jgi:ketosteroid isomerase-like protein